jgi:hypothetical protein
MLALCTSIFISANLIRRDWRGWPHNDDDGIFCIIAPALAFIAVLIAAYIVSEKYGIWVEKSIHYHEASISLAPEFEGRNISISIDSRNYISWVDECSDFSPWLAMNLDDGCTTGNLTIHVRGDL